MKEKEKKNNKLWHKIVYVGTSIGVAVAATILLPKFIDSASSLIYKMQPLNIDTNPEIVHRDKTIKEEPTTESKDTESQEED